VAAMGIGAAGAKNAGLFAVQILATTDPTLLDKLRQYREDQKKALHEKAAKIEAEEGTSA